MDEWKRNFDQWLWDSYVNVDKTTSQTVTEDYVKKIAWLFTEWQISRRNEQTAET